MAQQFKLVTPVFGTAAIPSDWLNQELKATDGGDDWTLFGPPVAYGSTNHLVMFVLVREDTGVPVTDPTTVNAEVGTYGLPVDRGVSPASVQ